MRKTAALLSCVLAAALSTLFTTCAPPVPVAPAITAITAAAEKPSPMPAMTQATASYAKADSQTAVTAERLTTLREQARKAEADAARASAEAARLKNLKELSEGDLLNFYNQLIEQEKLVKAMRLQVDTVEASLLEEKQLRAAAAAQFAGAVKQLEAREQETVILRGQLGEANTLIAKADKSLVEFSNARQAAATDADRLRGESALKTKLLFGAAGLLVLCALVIALLLKTKLFPL